LWHLFLDALRQRSVPTYLVCSYFWPNMAYFRWYGGAWRQMLGCFTHHYVQDARSMELLHGIGLRNVSVGGDTRYDRVAAIVDESAPIAPAQAFQATEGTPVLVCGSTWPDDEALLLKAMAGARSAPRLLVAPHELHAQHLRSIERDFPKPLALYGELEAGQAAGTVPPGIRTVLVERMGLLARLYRYGDVAYVGGGFGDGIHSLLEAAAWGRPVIFGPRHTRFPEGQGLIDAGGGFCVRDADELRTVLDRLLTDPQALRQASEAARSYVAFRVGATRRIVPEVLKVL
jgi:3-deoxy-D-manno-octulosonic-acid transferase